MVDFARLADVCSRLLGGATPVAHRTAAGDRHLVGAIVDPAAAMAFADADGPLVEDGTVVVHVPTVDAAGIGKGSTLVVSGVVQVVAREPFAAADGMTRLELREA
jgi:hypothetical protein